MLVSRAFLAIQAGEKLPEKVLLASGSAVCRRIKIRIYPKTITGCERGYPPDITVAERWASCAIRCVGWHGACRDQPRAAGRDLRKTAGHGGTRIIAMPPAHLRSAQRFAPSLIPPTVPPLLILPSPPALVTAGPGSQSCRLTHRAR